MSSRSKELDSYIAKSPDFARPILIKVRSLFHKACPEIQETIKWGMPCFEHHGIVGQMAAFKNHARFGFWKGRQLKDPEKIGSGDGPPSMPGALLTDVSQLPRDEVLLEYIKRAVALNDSGVKPPPRARKKATPLKVPRDLGAGLKASAKAAAAFKALSTSCRNEYVEWISEARQDATRQRRIATTIQWLEAGKTRNWKYEKK